MVQNNLLHVSLAGLPSIKIAWCNAEPGKARDVLRTLLRIHIPDYGYHSLSDSTHPRELICSVREPPLLTCSSRRTRYQAQSSVLILSITYPRGRTTAAHKYSSRVLRKYPAAQAPPYRYYASTPYCVPYTAG